MSTVPTVELTIVSYADPDTTGAPGTFVRSYCNFRVTCDAAYCGATPDSRAEISTGVSTILNAVKVHQDHLTRHTTGDLSSLARRVGGDHAANLSSFVAAAHNEALSGGRTLSERAASFEADRSTLVNNAIAGKYDTP